MRAKLFQVIFSFKNDEGERETYYCDELFRTKNEAIKHIETTAEEYVKQGLPNPAECFSIEEIDFLRESTEVLYGLRAQQDIYHTMLN